MKFYQGSDGGSGGPNLSGTSPSTMGGGSGLGGGGGIAQQPDLGKTNIDLTNPGSIIGALGSLGGMVGGLGIPGVATVGGVLGAGITGAENVAGGVGDIGFGGVGVKQAVGVAGDIAAAPGKYIRSEVGKSRASQYQSGHGIGGIGDIIAAAFATQGPEASALPADLQYKLDGGASLDEVAAELEKRNASFENEPLWNTLDSIALDPMNLVFGGIGKVGGLGKSAAEAMAMGRKLNAPEAFMGSMYRAATVGLPRAAEVGIVKALGPATTGAARALPEALPLAQRLGGFGADFGTQAQEYLGIANAQHLMAATADLSFSDAAAQTMLMMERGVAADVMESAWKNQLLLGKTEIENKVADLVSATMPTPTSINPAEIATETVAMLKQTFGVSDKIARQSLKGTKLHEVVQEWQAAYEMRYGAAVKDAVGLKALGNVPGVIDATKLTLVAPGTVWQQRAEKWAAELRALAAGDTAPAKKASAAIERFNAEHPPTGDLHQLDAFLGASKEAPIVTGDVASKMKEILGTNAELASQIAKDAKKSVGRLTAEDVAKYLDDHMETFPRLLEDAVTGKHALPAAVQAFKAKWGTTGYQLAMEPTNLTLTREVDGVTQLVRPWVPLASGAVDVVQRNPLGKVYEGLFGGIRQSRIISEADTRLYQSLAKRGVSRAEAHAIMHDVLTKANEANRLGMASTPRAVWHHYEEIFTNVLGAGWKAKGIDPVFEMNHALMGNVGTVGLTQKATGAAKTALSGFNNIGVEIAENIYPNLKFKLNPMFWAQEVIESPFWNLMRGINPWSKGSVSPEVQALTDALAKHDVARNVFEGALLTEVTGAIATSRAFGEGSKFGNAIRGLVDKVAPGLRTGGFGGFKSDQEMLQIAHLLPEDFKAAVLEVSPASWAAWEEKINPVTHLPFGKDAKAITEAFAKERLDLASGQKGLQFQLDAIKAEDIARVARGEKPLLATAEDQTVWQAFTYALRKSSLEAYKTHFFNPSRGALERTLNHPYLGLYPLSYMWGKVVPEFARFLFLKPFGRDVPFMGYSAATKVQQALLEQMQDPEFAAAMKKNAGAIYLIQLLLPATPTDIPVNSPAWMRHLAVANVGGKKYNPTNEINTGIQHIGVMNLPGTVSSALGGDLGGAVGGLQSALGGITDMLDQAAQNYDGNLGR